MRKPIVLGLAAAAAAAFTLSAAPVRAEMKPGTYVYRVNHSRHGEIGTHTIKLARRGAQTIAEVALKLRVRIILVTAHRESAQRREVWQGGRMVGYSSTTVENGKTIKVSAKVAGGTLVVTGPGGTKSAPLGTFPTNPWNIGILKARTVMDTKTGQIKKVVAIQPAGEELVVTGGGQVKARKYLFQDDAKRFLWFDIHDRLVKFRVFRDGSAVTFTLK